MAMFTPPPPLLVRQRSSSLQRRSYFNYRNSQRNISVQQYLATYGMNGLERSKSKSMSKIKSPSNSYTQFYKEGVLVGIERTSPNSRRISGEIIIEGIPIDDIWNILTDYDNLSTHVSNLVESKVINSGSRKMGGRPRVYQRGAQQIFGFEFGADVTMDMAEFIVRGQDDKNSKTFSVEFECVDSQFFSEFDGSWILEEYSDNKTMVRYIVDVRPKGPVPVAALEWRIKEDVPVNILAVSKSARARGTVRTEEQQFLSGPGNKETPSTSQLSMDRIRQSPLQPPSNPLWQVADQATQNFKRTAKSLLPTPVYSTARRAIKTINNSNPMAGAQESSQKNAVISTPLDVIGQKENSVEDTIVDWYEDETMATYLKYP